MHDQSRTRSGAVTVIGLGAMGQALAATWVEAGHAVTVWNRSPQKAAALVGLGAHRADDVAAAIRANDLIVVCVLDNGAVGELLASAADDLSGRTIVNLTTGTPGEARELADRVVANGATYVDGVIMAVPAMIGQPETMILYGGSRDAFDAHRSTLTTIAGNSPFLGPDAGLPALYDVGMLSLMYSTLTGWLQAFALVGAAGERATTFLPYLQNWFTNVVATVDSTEVAEHIDNGVYPDTTRSSVALNDAGLKLLIRTHREMGVDASVLAAISTFAERRVAEGHGADGYTSLIEAIKRPAGRTTTTDDEEQRT